jgi:alpha-galactosidase
VAEYKAIRKIVQQGNLYRLVSPQNGSEQSATESVSADRAHAVLFAFLHSSTENYPYPTVHLQGLDANAKYRIRAIAGTFDPRTPQVASGAYWMHAGIDLLMRGDFQAAGVVFDKE